MAAKAGTTPASGCRASMTSSGHARRRRRRRGASVRIGILPVENVWSDGRNSEEVGDVSNSWPRGRGARRKTDKRLAQRGLDGTPPPRWGSRVKTPPGGVDDLRDDDCARLHQE